MSMCVRYAGDSYTYLLDSVATDHGRAPAGVEASAMTHGTPPGTWLGAGLAALNGGAGLAVGSFVTPVQMERLFARAEDPPPARSSAAPPLTPRVEETVVSQEQPVRAQLDRNRHT